MTRPFFSVEATLAKSPTTTFLGRADASISSPVKLFATRPACSEVKALKKLKNLASRQKDQEDPLNRLAEALQKLQHKFNFIGVVEINDDLIKKYSLLYPDQKFVKCINDIETKVLNEFNQILKDDKKFETIIIPIRDGISISRLI